MKTEGDDYNQRLNPTVRSDHDNSGAHPISSGGGVNKCYLYAYLITVSLGSF